MAEFGGFGGYDDGKELDLEDEFEVAVNKVLGDRIRGSDEMAAQMWGALANVHWFHEAEGHFAHYTFRSAGDLIAAIRGSGNYMDWYSSAPHGEVSQKIAGALAREGWSYKPA